MQYAEKVYILPSLVFPTLSASAACKMRYASRLFLIIYTIKSVVCPIPEILIVVLANLTLAQVSFLLYALHAYLCVTHKADVSRHFLLQLYIMYRIVVGYFNEAFFLSLIHI